VPLLLLLLLLCSRCSATTTTTFHDLDHRPPVETIHRHQPRWPESLTSHIIFDRKGNKQSSRLPPEDKAAESKLFSTSSTRRSSPTHAFHIVPQDRRSIVFPQPPASLIATIEVELTLADHHITINR